MDGADDLAAVDTLEMDARDAEVGVLALYDDGWDAFVRHLFPRRTRTAPRERSRSLS
jgi:hypothetical protein